MASTTFASKAAVGSIDTKRAAPRQRAGLVEKQRARRGQRFQRTAALDQDSARGAARQARHHGDRNGKQQRTRRCHHDHGQRAHGIAAHGPADAGQPQRERDEPGGVAVGQAHRRRLGALRGFDQPDDACIRAGRGTRRRQQVEGIAGVHRAAAQQRAAMIGVRHGLAGQRRLVEHRPVDREPSIHRDHLAVPHQQAVARLHCVDRKLRQRVIAVHLNRARRARHQCRHRTPGAPLGKAFQQIAGRQHQRDHACGEALVQRQRARNRQQRQQIQPGLTPPQRHQHPPSRQDRRGRAGRNPRPVGGATRSDRPQRAANQKTHQRGGENGKIDVPMAPHVSPRAVAACIGARGSVPADTVGCRVTLRTPHMTASPAACDP
ncbi:MAG TPA: hypothetical protein VFQ95_09840 [Rhodanobacteraceae bacterium]|nr:hypothetical protein [Rhodanobacteraceae bacterium]